MKKSILLLLTGFISCLAIAQVPKQFNYQAIVRDNSGNPVINSVVLMRFTIHDTTASGTAVYTETQNAATNEHGLINLQIGSMGNMANVNWGTGHKFLQVELSLNTGTSYTDMGTTELLSVPYSLYAEKSNAELPYQEVYTYLSSTTRGTWIYAPDSIVVNESGTYLITFYTSGDDYQSQWDLVNYDLAGVARVDNVTSGLPVHDWVPFFESITDNDHNSNGTTNSHVIYKRSFSSFSTIQSVNAGAVLKIITYVSPVGSPTAQWTMDKAHLVIMKINHN